MGEWLRFVVAVAFTPIFIVEDLLDNRRFKAWKEAERQAFVDRHSGQ